MNNNLKDNKRGIKIIIMYYIYAVIIGIALMISAYIAYLWYTYIDETITSGEAYGFVIGENKLETYHKAPVNLAASKDHKSTVYIEIKSDPSCAKLLAVKPGHLLMVEAILHDVGYSAFESKNQWDFYFDGTYFDKLSLKFCDEKLCEIYRHRKKFELF